MKKPGISGKFEDCARDQCRVGHLWKRERKEVNEDLGLFGLLGLFRSMLYLYFETGNKGAKEKGYY